MTTITDAPTGMPSWQTAPCPSWCTWSPHDEREHPDDRNHASPTYRRTLQLERPVEVADEKWQPEYVGTYLWQHVREVEPTITLCKGESNEGFRLTLVDAEVVAELLLRLVRDARGTSPTGDISEVDAGDLPGAQNCAPATIKPHLAEAAVQRKPAVSATTCPPWCANQAHCRGDHGSEQTNVPATGRGTPVEVSVEGGAVFPIVAVGLDWSEVDGDPGPSVLLWKTGVGRDEEVYLQPREARELVAAVQAQLDLLT